MAMTSDDREWLWRELKELKDLMRAQNGRVGILEDAVLVIKTERAIEAREAVKRGTWAGILAAAGLTGMIEVLKVWTHR